MFIMMTHSPNVEQLIDTFPNFDLILMIDFLIPISWKRQKVTKLMLSLVK